MFISFEGIDGSGKTTQSKLCAEYFVAQNRKVHLTFEPTNNYIGSILRNILTHKQKASEEVIAGLFASDRLDHIMNTEYGLKKFLQEDYVVICDRYYLSSYAYNGVHCGIDWVMQLNAKAAELLKPNIHFFIDVSVNVALNRVKQNRQSVDLYETEENLKQVRENFFKAFEKTQNLEHIIIIDGNQNNPQMIHQEIIRHIEQYQINKQL